MSKQITDQITKPTGFCNKGNYFSGANTKDGFISYYDNIFNDRDNDKIVNILGGPGTGKSYFMKRLAEEAESLGIECERYFCSSDPASLDALRLYSPKTGKSMGVCDATEPHPRSLSTPVVTGDIYNVCTFLNREVLIKSKNEILELQEQKKKYYSNAYALLKAAGDLKLAKLKLLKDTVDLNAIRSSIKKTLGKTITNTPKRHEIIKRPIAANSMYGKYTLKPQFFNANQVFTVENTYGIGEIYFSEAINFANDNKISVFISPDPTVPELANCLYMPDASITITLMSPDVSGHKINTDKFKCSDSFKCIRSTLKKCNEAYKNIMDQAYSELAKAKDAHFSLESIYTASMNIKEKDKSDEIAVKRFAHFLTE